MSAEPIALAGPAAHAAAAPQAEPAESLFRKLTWLTLFRLATVTVLLGGTALTPFPWSGRFADTPGPLYGIILVTYLASLAFALALRAKWRLGLVAHLQVTLDVGIAAGVVLLTGRSESVFVFLFLLAIVNGSILLFRRGALLGAILSVSAYAPLALRGHPPSNAVTLGFIHLSAFVATAALAAYLSEQLRRTGERLVAREGALATITALHESIVQSVSSGLVTIDLQGRVTFLNRAGEAITGLPAEGLRGADADRWFGGLQGGLGRDEADYVNARGERLRLGYTTFPLVGGDGSPLGRAIIFQDLTRLREMEARVQRSERLAELGRVSAGLAHELRNPLAAMTGSIELLRATAQREDEVRLMSIVLREAARLEQLVSRFLAFGRPDPPRRSDVDLAEVARETLEVFRNDPAAARVELETDLARAPAWCDADQLRQVLWNLLQNAAAAAGGEGRHGRVRVRCAREGGGASLAVEDDGPGVPPEDLPHLFTPFFTRKASGTGLGLALVERIVDAHGGRVAVESAPGEGARFTVHLPARPASAGA